MHAPSTAYQLFFNICELSVCYVAVETASASDYVAVFKAKLLLPGPSQNQQAVKGAMLRLVRHYPQHLLTTAQPKASTDDASLLPSKRWLSQDHILHCKCLLIFMQLSMVAGSLPR